MIEAIAEPVVECRFYKAQRTIKAVPVESIAIVFDTEVPDCATLDEARELYIGDAELLERRLFQALPGGTYDQLLRAMLTRSASLFKVTHKD